MHIESNQVQINKSQEETFNLLSDVHNFKSLMPSSLEKFEVLGENTFKFTIKGMPEIKMELKDAEPHSKLVFGSPDGKLPFTLTGHIDSISDQASSVRLEFEGQFNAMMAMMVKSPITKFVETLSGNLPNLGQ